MPKELPRYVCHKEVRAVKIQAIQFDGERRVYHITAVEPDIEPILVTPEWQDKHGAKPGGYFVRYKDDYESFSPARAFEEGYTAVQA